MKGGALFLVGDVINTFGALTIPCLFLVLGANLSKGGEHLLRVVLFGALGAHRQPASLGWAQSPCWIRGGPDLSVVVEAGDLRLGLAGFWQDGRRFKRRQTSNQQQRPDMVTHGGSQAEVGW